MGDVPQDMDLFYSRLPRRIIPTSLPVRSLFCVLSEYHVQGFALGKCPDVAGLSITVEQSTGLVIDYKKSYYYYEWTDRKPTMLPLP